VFRLVVGFAFALGLMVRSAAAQDSTGWQFMDDGAAFGVVNHQGGQRGTDEFRVPNWWMGMTSRPIGSSRLWLNTMISLEPATAGESGYAELFQVGEALHGRPLVDRQHPHDFVMQLAAVWRTPIGDTTSLTVAGGPVGEPALGPVAFMHRASCAEYPFATLSHHIFDSTHIAYGVVTAAIDRGPWMVEGSVFNGREPDEERWDFDFGALNSASVRVWFQPTDAWLFEASTGHLVDPEELEPGNIQRTTMAASWLKQSDSDFRAITIGYGVNAAEHGTRQAMFAEGTRHVGLNSIFFRVESLQVETNVLLTDTAPANDREAERRDIVSQLTVGGVRDVLRWRGFEGGFGAAVTFYAVPDALKPSYGSHPISWQLYFRLRPPARGGRMWNMTMARPMEGHTMDHMHGR
jgi:hypothetical protein